MDNKKPSVEKKCAACGCKESENFISPHSDEVKPLRYNKERGEYVCEHCPLDPEE